MHNLNAQILEKITKLIALSQDKSNINESANAWALAQKLLEQHKLSMADVEAHSPTDIGEPIGQDETPLYSGKRAITWRGYLASGIANLNGCKVYWNCTSGGKALAIVGRQFDIDIVRYLYSTISSQIETFCKAAMMAGHGGGKTFSNNFRMGAVDTVTDRLMEAQKEVRKEYIGTSALVHINNKDAKVAEWLRENLKLKSTTAHYRSDNNGYSQGKSAGNRVDLSKGKLSTKISGLLT